MSRPTWLDSRKLRKLRRDPGQYARDAVRLRVADLADRIRNVSGRVPRWRRRYAHRRYSVVTAVYQVERYLERYFESMAGQTVAFAENIELIMVDDGSSDGSAAIIEHWRQRYPESIRYLRQDNAGQASARNLGLEHVKGDWVTFVDADDFVDRRYFERVDQFLDEHAQQDLSLLCCRWLLYYEKGRRVSDTHPLAYRFENGNRTTGLDDGSAFMASSPASSFFRGDLLTETGLRFDERIRPNFEDGHFCARYLLAARDSRVGFVADAAYYYRKRADGTSSLDTGWNKASRFDEVVQWGHLGLLAEAKAMCGEVPRWVQRLVLYDLYWYFERIVDDAGCVSFLSAAQKERFRALIDEVFEYLDADSIRAFSLAGCGAMHRSGFLCLSPEGWGPDRIEVRDYDSVRNLVHLAYYMPEAVAGRFEERFLVNGLVVEPVAAKTRSHDFLGQPFVHERLLWLSLPRRDDRLEVELHDDGVQLELCSGGATRTVTRAELEVCERGDHDHPWSPEAWVIRQLAARPRVRERFRQAWVFIDRDSQADDNAEHLYRYVQREHPEINAFFVLRRSSYDWDRLVAEGFTLVAFDSFEHRCLLLNARHLISSHADDFILPFMSQGPGQRTLDLRFTFLQHGVIRDDISRWLNRKTIDLFVTSSPREHQSIAASGTAYKFSELQTKMVGLARHDALVSREEPTEKVVLVIPTWRQYLVGSTSSETSSWQASSEFARSNYAVHWRGFLHSEELRSLVDTHGYRVVFFPHANMQIYLDWFEAPSWIEVRSHATEPVLQKLFRRAAVMITDYSSVFFEMGIQDKPVIYYQFDFAEMYAGEHPSSVGYFDFERDGFGPVATAQGPLLDALATILERGGHAAPEYLERMHRTLPLRDGGNCRRTVEAIRALECPVVDGS